jgi:hypothetical protein
MDLQRMKFAYARGARFEFRVLADGIPISPWKKIYIPSWNMDDLDYRIHPDDEHLQYGPISTAFRDAAISGDFITIPPSLEPLIFGARWHAFGRHEPTSDDRRLYDLVLGEYFADLGL